MAEPRLAILMVDDDEEDYLIIREMIRDIQRIHFRLEWVPAYDEGLELVKTRNWSAALIDYDLGINNGLDFIREAVQEGVRVPLIMVTGRGRYEIDLEAMQAGAADYITKQELNPSFLERSIRYAIAQKRVEEDLERRVEKRTQELKLLLDQTPAILWTTDRDLRITSIMGSGLAPLGILPEKMIGIHVTEIASMLPLKGADMVGVHQNALSGESIGFEMQAFDRYMRSIVQPLLSSEKEIIGCVGTALDVTENKRFELKLRSTTNLFEGLFEAAPDATLLVDDRGHILKANQQVQALFGYTPKDLQNQPIEILLPERFHSKHQKHREHYQSSPVPRPMGLGLDLFGQHKNGDEFPVDITLSPLKIQENTHVICAVRKQK